MRIVNVAGRLSVLVAEGVAVDVEQVSGGSWSSDPQAVFERWREFRDWASATGLGPRADLGEWQAGRIGVRLFDEEELGAPVPRPGQVFAIGLNYRDHAAETGLAVPTAPTVFTKFPASVTGPVADVELPEGDVDWEVELVAVVGEAGHRIREDDAWDHIAGLTVGQDLSERVLQFTGDPAQFSLGKSYPGFAPLGPVLVTPDELDGRDDLELGCLLNGEQMQKGRSSDMVFDIPALVSRLSAVTPLRPGDVIFTGTPPGVGVGRSPQRFLAPGDRLTSYVAGIGELHTTLVATGGA